MASTPTSTAPALPSDVREVAAAVHVGTRLLVRRLRQLPQQEGLSTPATVALAHLDRHGSLTSSALARLEQITPQAMGATVAALQDRGLVERHADPADRRNVLLSLSPAGQSALDAGRDARVAILARAIATGFTPEEAAALEAAGPLLARLAKVL